MSGIFYSFVCILIPLLYQESLMSEDASFVSMTMIFVSLFLCFHQSPILQHRLDIWIAAAEIAEHGCEVLCITAG